MTSRWRVTMFREPQPKPFDHPFEVTAPSGRRWVARTLHAAIRLVDAQQFITDHPELLTPTKRPGPNERTG